MRYVAPTRGTVEARLFGQLPLAAWDEYASLLEGADWPDIGQLNRCLPPQSAQRFVAQTPALLADGLHYEQRIAECGAIATRENNWHDLLNALAWLRHPQIKQALNRRQVDEIAHMGTRERSRSQYALTQFDEGGVIVLVRDPTLLALWDMHDWHGLFWQQRQAWVDGAISVEVFGHAVLEHALSADILLVGKALVFASAQASMAQARVACADAISDGWLLRDPLELRPLPLSGLPAWHVDNADENFHRSAACYQPRRAGREYPKPTVC